MTTETLVASPKKRARERVHATYAPYEPPYQHWVAAGICVLASCTLLWPLLTGHILFGGDVSDMYRAGYSFRLFGAEQFKQTGSIPQWNPYLFGGLPYIAAMHGDIFYPTAWLRWIMPVDLAITWGMVAHLVLAGWLTYRFARSLGLGWAASITGGVAYELTGIVASQMSPGHDGKLFVSALTPLAFWLLLAAIRDRKQWAYGAFALVVAFTVLGHYHMSYFLLLALGLWTLYLAFDPVRRATQSPWPPIAFATLAVVVGIGIAALQVVPFLEYIKYSPRADNGPATGWAFATSFAFPPVEIFTLLLPQFNGVLDHYWGPNPLKFHTEYVGVLPLVLATLAWGDRARRRLVIAFGVGAIVFLLFAWGGYSPLYRLLFNVLPMLNKIRAMGMVFFLVAFAMSMLAAIGMERVLSGGVSVKRLAIVAGCVAAFALVGAVGALQGLAEALASPEHAQVVSANAAELQAGALRLFLFALLSGGVLWAAATRRARGIGAAAAVLVVLVADLWSVDRMFYEFSPRADVLFRDDAITSRLKQTHALYRVFDFGSYGQSSILMAYGIPDATGYHGFELNSYDELGGHDHGWRDLLSPNLIDLLSIRYIIYPDATTIPGYHRVIGPVLNAQGDSATLYERDTIPPYARVVLTAAKVPESQQVPAIRDPRFPINAVALYDDTSSVRPDSIVQPLPASHVSASVTSWSPGRMSIALFGADARPGHLIVSENWYPDWHATVDGRPGVVHRADHSLLSVEVPAGAKQVQLWFDQPSYAKGKIISFVALLAALAMIAIPLVRDRRVRKQSASPLTG